MRVTVLVEVVVDMSSATAASGRRRAAKRVGRCILLDMELFFFKSVSSKS